MVSATTDSPTTVTPQPEPTALIALATSVSQGVRTSASRRRNQVLARSSSRSHDVRPETTNAAATMTTASRSHAVVLMAIGCGSGGGAPVGRRWRRARWAGESLGRPTAIGGLDGPTWAVVRPGFSLTAPVPGCLADQAAAGGQVELPASPAVWGPCSTSKWSRILCRLLAGEDLHVLHLQRSLVPLLAQTRRDPRFYRIAT